MRVIRFIDENGGIYLGLDQGQGQARVLEGGPWGNWTPTNRQMTIETLLSPIEPINIFCIGLNYRDHAREMSIQPPGRPVVFMKPTSTVTGPGAAIQLPACCTRGPEVDYEGELAVVIGRPAKDIQEDEALGYVLGYTCANDVSARRWQKQDGGGQWIRGKSFDTFCPLGPVLVTADELPDPQRLRVTTTLNGQMVQDQSTSDMIFSVARLISFLSQDTTLLPGTVILTGTPAGVGFSRNPPLFLKPSDEVAVEIESIGCLVNPVVQSNA